MLRHSHHRRLIATFATAAALAGTAPAALAMPIDGPIQRQTPPEPVRVVRVQVDKELDRATPASAPPGRSRSCSPESATRTPSAPAPDTGAPPPTRDV